MSNLVSVIMPCYNCYSTVGYSIKSVIEQTYVNWELILIDDGSTDLTLDILKSFESKYQNIFLFKNKNKKGVSGARNYGILHAKGDYLAFLDSDDLWKPNKLAVQIDSLIKNKYDLVCTNYETFKLDSNNIISIKNMPKKITYNHMLFKDWIGTLTVLVKNDKRIAFNEDLNTAEDYQLWLELLRYNFKFGIIHMPLASYRLTINSISSNKFKNVRSNYKMFRKGMGYNILKSVMFTAFNIIFKILKL